MKADHKYVSHVFSSFRSLLTFSCFRSFCIGSDDSALSPFIPRIAKDLGPFLAVTSEDTLSLVLETLAVVLDVDKGKRMTQDLVNALVTPVLDVWSKNNRGTVFQTLSDFMLGCLNVRPPDPIFLSIFPDIVNSLAASEPRGSTRQWLLDQLLSWLVAWLKLRRMD